MEIVVIISYVWKVYDEVFKTPAHLAQSTSLGKRVYVQHRGHLANVAGRALIRMLSSVPETLPISSRRQGGKAVSPGKDTESSYSQGKDAVPKDPSSTTDTSETMNRDFEERFYQVMTVGRGSPTYV